MENSSQLKYGNDELIILGSGGGRIIVSTQIRSTGGFILRCLNQKIQIHIDPGPGAIRDVNILKLNPKNTNYVLLTHQHTDHSVDVPIIIEALQKNLALGPRLGTLIAPKEYFENNSINQYYLGLLNNTIQISEGQIYIIEPGFKITGVHTNHCSLPNLGYILEFEEKNGYGYKIAFTSDTAVFPEYIKTYKGVDILVANLLRPDHNICRGHLCTKEFIPLLKEISPKICILVHFGIQMLEKVNQQIILIQEAVGNEIIVIGSSDGLHIPFAKVISTNKK